MSPHRIWIALAIVILSGCGGTSTSADAKAEKKNATSSGAVPHQRDADDVGRFIAGIPGAAGSPFTTLEATAAWKDHHQRLDEAWRKAETPLISKLQEFQKQELNDATLRTSDVFYPFSGPDSLMLVLWFPHSPTYVMVGLEPAGTLPGLSQFEKKDMSKYLAETRETVSSVLGRSFFVTHQMDRQFRGQVTDGLLLPILHLLVRRQNTILGFRYVRLDEQGQVVDRPASFGSPGPFPNLGVEIEFRADADQSTHTLYYFSANISDERLSKNKALLAYLSRLQGVTTLLKATSYMPHHANFSLIRDRILTSSAAVLQDDSGIPYRYFQTADWKTQLYGEYVRPYGSFRPLEQPDLRLAYGAGAKPLSLHVGYGYLKIASNLLLAQKLRK
ncbi:MAG: hypothetical protein ABIR70_20585 [Bryobacteraceae bacterium]